jgi:hypothetical protein
MKPFSDGEIKQCLEAVAGVFPAKKKISFLKSVYQESPLVQKSRKYQR